MRFRSIKLDTSRNRSKNQTITYDYDNKTMWTLQCAKMIKRFLPTRTQVPFFTFLFWYYWVGYTMVTTLSSGATCHKETFDHHHCSRTKCETCSWQVYLPSNLNWTSRNKSQLQCKLQALASQTFAHQGLSGKSQSLKRKYISYFPSSSSIS